MIGFGLVLFWLLTAIMADWVAVFDPYVQIRALKNEPPGTIDPESGLAFLFGGDALGRDVFSRMVYGSRTVMAIAPLATLFAYMIGITLGLPAGYVGGRFDTVLSFLANLVLAFPVILLFYLLVTPGDPPDGDPRDDGGGLLHLSRGLRVGLPVEPLPRPAGGALALPAAGDPGRRVRLPRAHRDLGSDRAPPDAAEHAQHLPGGRLHHLADGVPDRAGADARDQDAGLCGGGADPGRAALVHHDVGDPAERRAGR